MNFKYLSLLLILVVSSCTKKEPQITDNPYPYVNPFIGTGGEGHTYPGATVPFGMVQLSPDTDMKHYRKSFAWCAGYQYDDTSIMGFSHTHFSGTGHSDMGDVLLMPTVGTPKLSPGSKENPDEGYRSRFSHTNESAEPGYYQVLLEDYKINAELTATSRNGFHKYTFPKSDSSNIILDLSQSIYNYDDKVLWSEIRVENDSLITGYRQTKGWAANRYVFFAIRFSKPFANYGLVNEKEMEYKGFGFKGYKRKNYPQIDGKDLKAYFSFQTDENEEIKLKVGVSAVDINGAIRNMETEIPNWNFNEVREKAKILWEKELQKITVEGSREDKEIFYTSIYHSLLSPVNYMDVDKRYRGLDNSIHQAENFENYTIYSLWDTYRALHPLLTITQPERVGNMINSMLKHQEQNVHHILPVWSFHANETWCMIGYHATSVISDAIVKNIPGFDYNKAFDACKASANYAAYAGLEYYLKYDYVPIDLEHEGASKTLEYAYDDWAIAQAAKKLNKTADYETFISRASNYKNIFDKETKFMRARNSDGTFREPFDPLYAQYGGDYTEGNAWQYSWYVPQDPAFLMEQFGGAEPFVERLDSLFNIQSDDEMFKHVEDIAGLIGQYAHGNEPSQHIAYLYNWAGQHWRTQERIDQIMDNLFDNTPYGICGNEDCGQMSAWYIFSSLGFYPVCPGSNEYIIGTPSFERASISLSNNLKFEIISQNLSEENIYIQAIKLNGKVYNKSYIRHEDIVKGGVLEFTMGDKANKELKLEVPYSLSNK